MIVNFFLIHWEITYARSDDGSEDEEGSEIRKGSFVDIFEFCLFEVHMANMIHISFLVFHSFHRDLAFALFCASAKKEKRANGFSNDSTASDNASSNWSIPGCHVTVSCELFSS